MRNDNLPYCCIGDRGTYNKAFIMHEWQLFERPKFESVPINLACKLTYVQNIVARSLLLIPSLTWEVTTV